MMLVRSLMLLASSLGLLPALVGAKPFVDGINDSNALLANEEQCKQLAAASDQLAARRLDTSKDPPNSDTYWFNAHIPSSATDGDLNAKFWCQSAGSFANDKDAFNTLASSASCQSSSGGGASVQPRAHYQWLRLNQLCKSGGQLDTPTGDTSEVYHYCGCGINV